MEEKKELLKEPSKEKDEDVKQGEENKEEPQEPLFGGMFDSDKLYLAAFMVLGALILLCVVNAFLLGPDM